MYGAIRPMWKRALARKGADIDGRMSLYSSRSLLSTLSIGSVGSVLSIGSAGSILASAALAASFVSAVPARY
jgi:hypothetical protein